MRNRSLSEWRGRNPCYGRVEKLGDTGDIIGSGEMVMG